jgi:cytosine/adenosine deaminase-related metal-dependent hydrolase
LDIILSIAKNLGKPVDVHVDQENNPDENETELLALKAIEHGMEGRVRAVHSVSLAAKDQGERKRIMRLAKDAGLGFIVCPSAALSMKQLQMYAPLHNSIAPVEELVSNGLPVYLGVDNIHDLFMPLVDGDMWTECRFLMEACRYYELETVAGIATDKSGFSA